MILETYIRKKQSEVESCLKKCLPPEDPEVKSLWDSITYSLYSEGKRTRPVLMHAVYESITSNQGNDHDQYLLCTASCALEIIHTSSLILDDLPAMDNATHRRGKNANHIVYGEAIALLAADALQTYAMELIAREIPGMMGMNLIHKLSETIGTKGMIGGQMVDLQYKGKPVDYDTLIYIHLHKSGKLFEYAAYAGAMIAQASPEQVQGFVRFASQIGLAYQITDDILDYENEGLESGEVNFVTILGLESAKNKVNELILSAINEILFLNQSKSILLQIADYVKNRVN